MLEWKRVGNNKIVISHKKCIQTKDFMQSTGITNHIAWKDLIISETGEEGFKIRGIKDNEEAKKRNINLE